MAMPSGTVPGGTSAALATSTDISSVSDLISQLNNSVALCLAADQAVKPTTLRLLWARRSQEARRDAERLLPTPKEQVAAFSPLTDALCETKDPVTGKDYSMSKYQRKVRKAIVDLLTVERALGETIADAQVKAVAEETTKVAALEVFKVAKPLKHIADEVTRLNTETRIKINGLESLRRAAQKKHAEIERDLIILNTEMKSCVDKAADYSKLSTNVWTGDPASIDKASQEQMYIYDAGRKAMEGRIAQLENSRLQLYSGGDANSGRDKSGDLKTITQMLPNGAVKSSAYHLGQVTLAYCRQRPRKFHSITHHIERIVNDFDPILKEHWMPPCIEANKGVAAHTGLHPSCIEIHNEQSANLYEVLRLVVGDDVLLRLKQQNEKGSYAHSDETFRVPVNDGVMLFFGLITSMHDVHADHVQEVIATLHNAWVYFTKGSIESACEKVRVIIEECTQLGIQVEWQLTGRRIIQVISGRPSSSGITSDIRPMLKGPTVDPNNPNEHSLPYLEELITKCQRAVREIEHDLPPAPKQVYKAFMGRLLDINTADKGIDDETVRERLDDALGRMDRSKADKKRARTSEADPDLINAKSTQIDLTLCQVKGCTNKKTTGMQTRFCGDCFNKYKANKQPIPLKDGTTRDPIVSYQPTTTTKGKVKGKGKGGKGKGKGNQNRRGTGRGNGNPNNKGTESKFFNRLLTMMSDGTISLKEPDTDEEKQKKKKQKLAEDMTKKLKAYGMSGIADKLQIED